MQAVHPYQLLAQRDADACLAAGQNALREWQAHWHPDAALALACIDAAQAGETPADSSGTWAAYGATADTALWVRREAGFERQLERFLFDLDQSAKSGERRESELAGAVVAGALRDLEGAMLAAFAPGNIAPVQAAFAAPPAWLLRRSAGTAVLRLSCGGKALDLFVPHTQLPARKKPVAPHTAPHAALTPLSTALRGCEARLTVQLGETEISLGSLASLAVGDVLRLPVGLDEPLKIFAGTGRQVGLGHLGQQDGNRAVEIFAIPQKP
jgi:flagellar motor switch/type III secretory pathway protein FliN